MGNRAEKFPLIAQMNGFLTTLGHHLQGNFAVRIAITVDTGVPADHEFQTHRHSTRFEINIAQTAGLPYSFIPPPLDYLNPLYAINSMDINELISRIKAEEVVEEALVRAVCRKVQEIFVDQSNLEPIRAPINVVGDVHGQFYDVLHLINLAGDLPDHSYVFIGDFVDRGYNSLETIMLLFLLKIKHPERIFLLRGNHESRQISCVYGFYEQTNRKYGSTNIWKYFNETFDYLPLSAVIDNSIFCVHGGLSPSIHALDQIREIDRKCQIPTEGPFADLMWSDPQEIDSWVKGQRGAGWLFGEKIVNQFNEHNGLKLIARAHQLAQQGYVEWFENKNLATVWSAPNYCYRCNNLASYMSVNEHGKHDFHTFKADDKSKDSNHYRNVIPYFL